VGRGRDDRFRHRLSGIGFFTPSRVSFYVLVKTDSLDYVARNGSAQSESIAVIPPKGTFERLEEDRMAERIIVDHDKCEGSGDCVTVCPQNALSLVGGKAVLEEEKCDRDGLCIPACPKGAIGYMNDMDDN
jgi:NAD-dependent dihydropyrimidine dehydrogenase PreA subunit